MARKIGKAAKREFRREHLSATTKKLIGFAKSKPKGHAQRKQVAAMIKRKRKGDVRTIGNGL